jgi:anti-sigma regulatory factor (Ser/Thr protein kinase)
MAVTASFPSETRAVSDARRFVLEAGDVPDEAAGDVALLVSEVASNAVLHARSPFTVTVERRGSNLRVAVSDSSAVLPVVKHLSNEATTGRGLRILGHLAQAWGVEPDGDGKTVWFEVDLDQVQIA